jgi:hypothetical protein
MHRFLDPARPADGSRTRRQTVLPSAYCESVGTSTATNFGARYPSLRVPLPTLRRHPHERQRTARGHRGSLLLRCRALSSPSPCRFIPAPPQTDLPRPQQRRPAWTKTRNWTAALLLRIDEVRRLSWSHRGSRRRQRASASEVAALADVIDGQRQVSFSESAGTLRRRRPERARGGPARRCAVPAHRVVGILV